MHPSQAEASPPPALHDRRHVLGTLRDEIDRLFDEVSLSPFQGRLSPLSPLRRLRADWSLAAPAIDVVDGPEAITVRADLPGLAPDDVDVELREGVLTIRGEKRESREKGEKEGEYYISERSYGAFERTLRLPEGADPEKIEARMAAGVLTLTIPKTEKARAKAHKIKIKQG